MTDHVDAQKRSLMMSRIRSKDTGPELIVRQIAHALGLRFRLHHKGLPGKPDLVFTKRRTCIFVHGCFWHRHPGCRRCGEPKSRQSFWQQKFERNIRRDEQQIASLQDCGWNVHVIWECETRDREAIAARLRQIFDLPLHRDGATEVAPSSRPHALAARGQRPNTSMNDG